MDPAANHNTLEKVDWRLLNFFPEFEDLAELGKLLERRSELVGELAQTSAADPTELTLGRLQRSLQAGHELTRKLAAYRRMLESELARVKHVAYHGRVLDEDLANDVSGNDG